MDNWYIMCWFVGYGLKSGLESVGHYINGVLVCEVEIGTKTSLVQFHGLKSSGQLVHVFGLLGWTRTGTVKAQSSH